MLYREIIAVCSQIHTKHINTVCGQNVELLNVRLTVYIVINDWALEGRTAVPVSAGSMPAVLPPYLCHVSSTAHATVLNSHKYDTGVFLLLLSFSCLISYCVR